MSAPVPRVSVAATPHLSLRQCLLLLGAAGLAGGRPVHEVEAELRGIGVALGAPDTRVAATPTGVFVSLGSDEAAGFEAVGSPLRFDQAAAVTAITRRMLAAELDPEEGVAALREALRAPARVSRPAAATGLVGVAAGIALVLQPAWSNVLVAVVCSLLVAGLVELAARSPLVQTLLPVLAAFTVGCLVFVAADAGLVDGPLRTLLPPLAILLPGAVIVTGMSELAAGAMVAGTSRLVFGTVQLLLLAFGLLAAVRVSGIAPGELTNTRVDELGGWAPWTGLLLLGSGVFLNLSAPRGVLPWMLLLLLATFGAQSAGQAAYGAPAGGFCGAVVATLAAAAVQRIPGGPASLVVFLPSFWLLVPGSLGLLGTTQLAVASSDGFATAIGAVAVIVGIALGVLTGTALGRGLGRPVG